MGRKTQQVLLQLNKLFRVDHPYSDLLIESKERAFLYSVASGDLVYDQFYGFNDFKDKCILDYGCGCAGKSVSYASKGAKKVIAVDLENDYGLASQYARKNRLPVEFQAMVAGGAMNVADMSIDIVVSSSVLEHIPDVLSALSDIYRVLKPHGLFLNRWHPYRSRYGSHIKDAIGVPFVHLLFNERDVMRSYTRELERRFSGIPKFFKKLNKESSSYADLDFTLNKLSMRQARLLAEKAGFSLIQRRYYRNNKQVVSIRLLPEWLRDYCVDYEVTIFRKCA